MMRATSLGHAGILIETAHGSIVCDPWFVPAFFGVVVPVPPQRPARRRPAGGSRAADYLYVSHLHGDHFDEPWLPRAPPPRHRRAAPGYPTRELDRELRALGFTEPDPHDRRRGARLGGGGLTVAIHVETSITDGPGGDSALVVSDGTCRLVNQNDCRTTDLDALAAHGPVDLHWLQYSGAIWYPMVYEMDDATMRQLVDAKVESQLARAMRYVESIDARAVVPVAGPPCFLDPELFHLNVVDGDEPSIFVDQRTFLARLAASGHAGVLAIPGTTIEVGRRHRRHATRSPTTRSTAIFERQGRVPRGYQADWSAWLTTMQGAGPRNRRPTSCRRCRSGGDRCWRPGPTVRGASAPPPSANRLRTGPGSTPGRHRDPHRLPRRRGAPVRRRAVRFRFDIARPLVEKVVAERAVDWSNSLFLSCRFRAWRDGEFNEYVYNFFKSLSPARMRRTEAEALRKLHPPTETEPDIELDGWVVQRRCPHRNADLSVFGEVDGRRAGVHAARLALRPGDRPCLTTAGHPLRPPPPQALRRVRSGAGPPQASSGAEQLLSWRRGPRRGCASA